MSLPVEVRPLAVADIRSIHDELEAIRAGLGGQFLIRLRDVLDRVEASPELYGAVWQDVRAARLRRFRHVVYYVVLPDRVQILAVMHGSRDPSAWQSRA